MVSRRTFAWTSILAAPVLLVSLLCCDKAASLEGDADSNVPPQAESVVPASRSSQGGASARPYAPETVVATVGSRHITLGELGLRFAALSEASRQAYLASDAPLERFLQDVTSNMLVVLEAEALDLGSDPMFSTLLEAEREDVLRDLYARRALLRGFNDEMLRARYEEQRGRFTVEPRVHLRHILVTPVKGQMPLNEAGEDVVGEEAARRRATELRAEILAGADFAEVARRSSEDASARRGGDLGWVAPERLVPQLAATATTLPPGELSDVVRSDLGFHVVEVVARREPGVVPFEVVRELLLQEAVAENRDELARLAAEDRDRLSQKYGIELHLERLPW